jgi:hypothetical protein
VEILPTQDIAVMKISPHFVAQSLMNFSHQPRPTLTPPSTADAQWFAAQLSPTKTVVDSADKPLSRMAAGIAQYDKKSGQVLHDLDVASRSSDMMDFSRANAELSDFYIQNLMNSKVINKCVQGINKLVYMQ